MSVGRAVHKYSGTITRRWTACYMYRESPPVCIISITFKYKGQAAFNANVHKNVLTGGNVMRGTSCL